MYGGRKNGRDHWIWNIPRALGHCNLLIPPSDKSYKTDTNGEVRHTAGTRTLHRFHVCACAVVEVYPPTSRPLINRTTSKISPTCERNGPDFNGPFG